jgi:hypothetical protein
MQVKQMNTPLHTSLVTLFMHTLQAHHERVARATVRTTGNPTDGTRLSLPLGQGRAPLTALLGSWETQPSP